MIVIDMKKPINCKKCPIHHNSLLGKFCPIDGHHEPNLSADFCPIKCDIEDIKQEIQYEADNKADMYSMQGYYNCLDIIDKHTKGGTNADSN